MAPIVRFALAYAAGVAAGLLSVPVWISLLVVSIGVILPAPALRRPLPLRGGIVMAAAAGALAGYATSTDRGLVGDPVCGDTTTLTGRFIAPPLSNSAPFARFDGCGTITVVVSGRRSILESAEEVRAGDAVQVQGRMRAGRRRPWFQATRIEPMGRWEDPRLTERVRWSVIRFRGEVVRRTHDLYGDRAPLVTALMLARTEGLDPEVRQAFAGAGIAHLLAISGFHVGVVAGLISTALAGLPWGRRRRRCAAALITSAYVALIGFPVSACRAALIFVLTSLSVLVGRVPSRWGALGASAFIVLWLDPRELGNPGFQLSFAGAAGLVSWARPVESWLLTCLRGSSVRLPRTLVSATGAGIAATVATLPFVDWHFERVALLGIPATLLATPLVSLALTGSTLSVGLSVLWPGGSAFLAGGVIVVLDVLSHIAQRTAGLAFGSVWISPATVIAGGTGVLFATWLARRPGVGGIGRRRLTGIYLFAGVLVWPMLVTAEGRGSLDLWMIDVGQGDAMVIRTPKGSWILVDAGPPSDVQVSAQPVVRTLRSLGVRSIDLLVLTHPDADHIGGVPGVLKSFRVERILDPALPVGKSLYEKVIMAAESRSIAWSAARAGQQLEFDGVRIDVLHPSDSAVVLESRAGTQAEANRVSVVLGIAWHDVDILLAGDAYTDVEEALAGRLGDIEVLKVGHHGSLTSTSRAFVDATSPEHALVSVGRSNRYGHPAPAVLARLSDAGAVIHRTDEQGTVKLRVARDGRIRVTHGR
ncbi:MAG: DNA internalization-related competence protein ComEC/Rec2 [Gemmatimonadota bacterium]|nr:DNA internalization-related competence protein ComEC/Rec2 [Gemmatimonadota bacterium]MDE3015238.1 DNA internalization-related competence protein ComEC/Rec2 [Gemmatimonadota bacterium]